MTEMAAHKKSTIIGADEVRSKIESDAQEIAVNKTKIQENETRIRENEAKIDENEERISELMALWIKEEQEHAKAELISVYAGANADYRKLVLCLMRENLVLRIRTHALEDEKWELETVNETKGATVTRNSRFFEGSYEDRFCRVQKLVEKLDHWMSNDALHSHSNALINGTGTGKTRAVVEICRQRRAVYVSLSEDNSPIYSQELSGMFLSLKVADNQRRSREARRLLLCLMQAAKDLSFEALFNSQFSDETELLAFVSKVKEAPAHIGRLVSFDDDSEQISSENSNLMIIIDDADHLLDEEGDRGNRVSDSSNVIITLRRAASRIRGCYLLFVSTSTAVQYLLPLLWSESSRGASTSPASRRQSFPPLFDVGNCLHFNELVPFPFNMGRPLWSALCRDRHSNLFANGGNGSAYVADVQALLIGRDSSIRSAHVAVFMSRFWLIAQWSTASDLVQHHLAIVAGINTEEIEAVKLTSHYLFEPIVAEAAAVSLFDGTLELKNVVATVKKGFTDWMFDCNEREASIACGAAMLAYSMDSVRFQELMSSDISNYHLLHRSFSSPLPLRSVLQRLLSKYNNRWHSAALAAGLAAFDGYSIQCTHFSKLFLEEKLYSSTNETLFDMFLRRLALFSTFSSCVDLVIPIFNNRREPGLVLVRVKNSAKEITNGKSLLSAMRPRSVTGYKDLPCVCLLLAVGNGCQPYIRRCDHTADEDWRGEEETRYPRLEATLCREDFKGLLGKELVNAIGSICEEDRGKYSYISYFDERSVAESERILKEQLNGKTSSVTITA